MVSFLTMFVIALPYILVYGVENVSDLSDTAVLLEIHAGVTNTERNTARIKRTTKVEEQWITDTQYAKSNIKGIFGRFEIEGEIYRLACSCLPADPPASSSQCYPREVKIEEIGRFPGRPKDPQHPMLDARNLRALIGPPSDLRMVQVEDQIFSSPDGRSSDEIMGTWGGDAGELFLKLTVWEDLTGIKVNKNQVKELILRFLRYDPRPYFYMHTDTIALAWVQSFANVQEWFDPTNPPPALRRKLLQLFVQPQAMGSELFKQIAEAPELFNTRYSLLKWYIECLYEILWDPQEALSRKIKYYVLHSPGARQESAFVEFEVSEMCQEETRFPIFPPYSDGISIFVYHPTAISIHRDITANILVSMTQGNLQLKRIREELKLKGKIEQLENNNPILAGLPKYRVTISEVYKE